MQNIHSTADILAQVINDIVLKGYFKEKCVSASKIKNQLECIKAADGVSKGFREFIKSSEYKYVNAFVNTIKHRKLIECVLYAEFGVNTENKFGIKFESFTYGKEYPSIYADTVLNNYYIKIEKHINEVGYQIKKYLNIS